MEQKDRIEEFHKTQTYLQLAKAVGRITKAIDAERSTLFFVTNNGDLTAMVAEGVKQVEIKLRMGQGVAGKCAFEKKVIIENHVDENHWVAQKMDQTTGFKTKSIIAIPIISRIAPDKVIGVIETLNKVGGEFNENDESILRQFSSVIGMVIESRM
jgi:adenylate cyclase